MKRSRSDLSCSDRKKDISHVVIMMLEFIKKKMKLGSWLQLIY